MSFSINESKVEELLKSSNKGYEVSTSSVGAKVENIVPLSPYGAVSGTIYAAPILVTVETKEHLMDLRRKIEESGAPLKDADDLTLEIGKMRRKDL
ncbi:MAG TPA: hypothetical protein VG028_11885 [Terriglobia bacterium]|nr:hypothetical protein [Terriglobia bacterium]